MQKCQCGWDMQLRLACADLDHRLQEMSYESDHRGLSLVGADDGGEAVGEERDDSCGASAY
jgi:hypothetical protein